MRAVTIPALGTLVTPIIAAPALASSGIEFAASALPAIGVIALGVTAIMLVRAKSERERRIPVRIRSPR